MTYTYLASLETELTDKIWFHKCCMYVQETQPCGLCYRN